MAVLVEEGRASNNTMLMRTQRKRDMELSGRINSNNIIRLGGDQLAETLLRERCGNKSL